MRNIPGICLLVLTIAALLFSAGFAEETEAVLSEREKAIILADQAMAEKYGITLLTQEYFDRKAEEKLGNVVIVEYTGADALAFVLGTYKVTVENGAVTDIRWTHDGEDTSGGLKGEAWGKDQILEMLRLNQYSGDMAGIYEYADVINRKHNLHFAYHEETDAEAEARWAREAADHEEAQRLCTLTLEQVDDIGARAVQKIYQLTEEQVFQLEKLYDAEDDNYLYEKRYDIPCVVIGYGLGEDDDEKEIQADGLRYREKEGVYWVWINVLTGVVEEASFSYGIGGNG